MGFGMNQSKQFDYFHQNKAGPISVAPLGETNQSPLSREDNELIGLVHSLPNWALEGNYLKSVIS